MEEKIKEEIIKKIINIVWEATDGGTKLDRSSFSHFEEPLGSLEELYKYIDKLRI